MSGSMKDLQEENERLKLQLEAYETEKRNACASNEITITGPGGSPIYARGNLNNATSEPWDDNPLAFSHYVEMANPDTSQCPVREIENAEIRRGGVFSCTFGEYIDFDYNGVYGDGDIYEQVVYLFSSMDVYVKYGPLPESQGNRDRFDPESYENHEIAEVQFTRFRISY
ncbi:MAG: hypothetical protein SGARI_004680 [Bacillariaceae sp.]